MYIKGNPFEYIEDLTCRVLMFFEFIKRVEENDKMRGLPSILSFFCNKFDKFNNAGATMLDLKYMT